MRILILAALAAIVGATAASAADAPAEERKTMAPEDIALPGQGPWQRFIVKYRDDSAPGRDPAAVPERLRRTAEATGLASRAGAPALRWERRLGVRADLIVAEPALDRAQAQRLLRELAAEPDVQYAEPDAPMQAGPGPAIRGPSLRGD
ncbi:hypothetical protein [Luteimonas huabeiensis]|uniref:hypothetical protein n=1 Tax=Luteimonas huabeiensis TaxID=1244513 RepID=UPI0004645A9F|nr:hypothetical protein [Luteimonas huabeiensis]